MANLRISKFDLFFKRRPSLPDWYKFLAYFLAIFVFIAIFFNMVKPESNTKVTQKESKVLTSVTTEESVNNSKEQLVEILTYDGGKKKISSTILSVVVSTSQAILTNDFSSVPMDDGDTPPIYNITSDSKIDNLYLNNLSDNNASFTLLINENPNSNSKIRTSITIRLVKENGIWIFPSNINQGV